MPGSLEARHGTARRPDRPVAHRRPDGVTDASIDAVGKLSAALEVVEHARGHLYAFHRLCGTADRELREAVQAIRAAGHAELADDIDRTLVGRDVAAGRWTFQLVEDYDANYWEVFRDANKVARESVGNSPSHVFEAEMKHNEQTS